MNRPSALLFVAALLCGCAGQIRTSDQAPTQNNENAPASFAERFESLRNDPSQATRLAALLSALPKGGELHSHLSGAVTVDELLQIADQKDYRLAFTPNGTEFCGFAYGNLYHEGFNPDVAPKGCTVLVPPNAPQFVYRTVSEVKGNAAQLSSVHDVLTIEHSEIDGERSDFKQFNRVFNALDKLTDNPDVMGELVASIMTDAYENKVSYIELMLNPIGRDRVGYDKNNALAEVNVPIAETLNIISRAIDRTNTSLRTRWIREGRYLPPELKPGEWPSSWLQPVEVRVIMQGKRIEFARMGDQAGSSSPTGTKISAIECTGPKNCPSRLEQGYYLASIQYMNLVVGMDIVGLPEKDYNPGRSSNLQFGPELRRLRGRYGDASIKLHAGETEEQARYPHIEEAITLGASRLGHAFSFSVDPKAQRALCGHRIPIEISLTSNYRLNLVNDVVDHPFPDFFRGTTCGMKGIYFPVTLNTDNAGIFQTNMTNEFSLAVKTFNLTWDETKLLALNSLVYGFMNSNDKAALINRWREEITALERTWQW